MTVKATAIPYGDAERGTAQPRQQEEQGVKICCGLDSRSSAIVCQVISTLLEGAGLISGLVQGVQAIAVIIAIGFLILTLFGLFGAINYNQTHVAISMGGVYLKAVLLVIAFIGLIAWTIALKNILDIDDFMIALFIIVAIEWIYYIFTAWVLSVLHRELKSGIQSPP